MKTILDRPFSHTRHADFGMIFVLEHHCAYKVFYCGMIPIWYRSCEH